VNLKQAADQLLNQTLLKPFGLKLSFRAGVDPVEDMVSLLRGSEISVVVDGGAYEGAFSRQMQAAFPGASIHAFEPTPDSFARLQLKTRDLPSVRCCRLALGAEPGTAQFFQNASPLTNSLRKSADANRRYFADFVVERDAIVVEVTTLADYAAKEGLTAIDIVKLDLQGGELDAIIGLGSLLGTVKALLVEVQFVRLYDGSPLFSDIETHLCGAGLSFFQFYELVRSPDDGRLLYGDALFVSSALLARA
jgi:FkbM family methyltransferase